MGTSELKEQAGGAEAQSLARYAERLPVATELKVATVTAVMPATGDAALRAAGFAAGMYVLVPPPFPDRCTLVVGVQECWASGEVEGVEHRFVAFPAPTVAEANRRYEARREAGDLDPAVVLFRMGDELGFGEGGLFSYVEPGRRSRLGLKQWRGEEEEGWLLDGGEGRAGRYAARAADPADMSVPCVCDGHRDLTFVGGALVGGARRDYFLSTERLVPKLIVCLGDGRHREVTLDGTVDAADAVPDEVIAEGLRRVLEFRRRVRTALMPPKTTALSNTLQPFHVPVCLTSVFLGACFLPGRRRLDLFRSATAAAFVVRYGARPLDTLISHFDHDGSGLVLPGELPAAVPGLLDEADVRFAFERALELLRLWHEKAVALTPAATLLFVDTTEVPYVSGRGGLKLARFELLAPRVYEEGRVSFALRYAYLGADDLRALIERRRSEGLDTTEADAGLRALGGR